MKIKILLLGAVITAISISTTAMANTPRGEATQIKTVKSSPAAQAAIVVYAAPDATLLTPRAAGNQIVLVKGASANPNPALECRNNMVGSPKVVAECGSHTTMPGCMKVASMK